MSALAALGVHPGTAPRIAVVMGTRPEIIKLAPVIHALGAAAHPLFTGQHYDAALTDVFFDACAIPRPRTPVEGVGGRPRGEQIAAMIDGLGRWFTRERPDAVVVQGDTNSASAAAQAAHYLGVPVVHVEAGLRSGDRAMPEEVNRMVISAVADVHCCPTGANAANLLGAGVDPAAVHVTGNPVVEATRAALARPSQRAAVLERAGLAGASDDDPFVLATVHRPENTDDPAQLAALMGALGALGHPVVLPLHPRTADRLVRGRVDVPAAVRVVAPVDHETFLALAQDALLVVSDSGGVQEEVTVLGRPLVVVRRSTERPESVDAGFSVLSSPSGVAAAAAHLLRPGWPEHLRTLASPFGDGLASVRIAGLSLLAAGAAAPAPVG